MDYKSPQLHKRWCGNISLHHVESWSLNGIFKGVFPGFLLKFCHEQHFKASLWKVCPIFLRPKAPHSQLHTCSSSRNDGFCCIYIHIWIRSTFSVVTFLKNLGPSPHFLFIFHIVSASKPSQLRSCKFINDCSYALSAGLWITRINTSK